MAAMSRPVIGEMSRRNMNDYYYNLLQNGKGMGKGGVSKALLVYIFYPTPRSRASLRRELVPTAKRFRDKGVTFVSIDVGEYGYVAAGLVRDLSPQEGEGEEGPQGLGLELSFPAVIVHDVVRDEVFVYDGRNKEGIRAEGVERLLVDVLRGQAKPGVQVFGSDDDGDGRDEKGSDGREERLREAQEVRKHDEL